MTGVDNSYAKNPNLWASLNPEAIKIDGRDNRDRLAFSARYAELILYYNKNNQAAGNWQPFFVKDPAILMALISKTDYSRFHLSFCQLYEQIQQAQQQNKNSKDFIGAAASINALFTLLMNLFVLIDRWVGFMNLDQRKYALKDFIDQKIRQSLASLLWQSLALQQRMSRLSNAAISPPDYGAIEAFQPIWRESGYSRSLTWQGEDATLQEGNGEELLEHIQSIYQKIFSFVLQVTETAKRDFYTLEIQPNDYPDTALLISFSHLMDLARQNINNLSRKHLHFYYDKVLRQTRRAAIADEVYLCLQLTDKTSAYTLPANTTFLAGTYADKTDILFTNPNEEILNLAAVDCAYSQLYLSPGKTSTGLYLEKITQLDQIRKNPAGEVLPWDGFGSIQKTATHTGFAIASPMLYLGGGQRTITLTFVLDQPLPVNYFADAKAWLSTEKEWYAVTMSSQQTTQVDPDRTLKYQISLQADAPAIVPFAKNPDGYTSQWPLLKIRLGPSVNQTQPVQLQSLTISVSVTQLPPQIAGNNVAALTVGTNMQILGAVPAQGSYFYAGSAECFAKALKELSLCQLWDNVPEQFHEYYQAYNDFLANANCPTPWYFSNAAFTGSWTILAGKKWRLVDAAQGPQPKPSKKTDTQSNDSQSNNSHNNNATPVKPTSVVQLFQQNQTDADNKKTETEAEEINLAASVYDFSLTDLSLSAHPQLLLSPLPQITQAENGYLRFQLTAPARAFGHDLYAKVVSAISLHNAQVLIGQADAGDKKPKVKSLIRFGSTKDNSTSTSDNDDKALTNLPNLPWVPQISSLYLNYQAESTNTFKQQQGTYPFELFHYGPLNSYAVYDSSSPQNSLGWKNLSPITPQNSSSQAIPLFTTVSGEGCLYLGLKNVVTPGVLSLLVELAQDPDGPLIGSEDIAYFYWGSTGWENIRPIYDGTHNLLCSGILKFDLPAVSGAQGEAYTPCPLLPNDDFWLAVTGKQPGIKLQIIYLNTQAVKLQRVNLQGLAAGEKPQIPANIITGPKQKIPQLQGVAQAFPSFGGAPAENDQAYTWRVSQRLHNKDRISSQNNYENMAHLALDNLYYARQVIDKKNRDNIIHLGLIPRYHSAQDANAFSPHMSACDMDTVRRFIKTRVSPLATFHLLNFKHQQITIHLTLQADAGTNGSALIKKINQQLKCYLSPWIASQQAHTTLDIGLARADLLFFIHGIGGVKQIEELSIDRDGKSVSDDVIQASKSDAILISAAQHDIKVVSPTAQTLRKKNSGVKQ